MKNANRPFTGTVVRMNAGLGIVPDSMDGFTFKIKFDKVKGAKPGEKVSATICNKTETHFLHTAEILKIFGDSSKASVCCYAILDENNVKKRFDKDTLAESEKIFSEGISEKDFEGRLDLRGEKIFTIDAKESKDLDDAISIKKTDDGYVLGVHIADVSHYVVPKSKLDNEAFTRGTSVYYANSVIPMLPKELSNGICSLSEGEDRLAFSAFVELDSNCKVTKSYFKKSIINSNIKGIYSEINSILDDSADDEIKAKYEIVSNEINILNEMTDILIKNRTNRGALEIESSEAKLIIDEDGNPTDIIRRDRGKSERIVEECMLLANEASAFLARSLEIPFIYRVHENPPAKKVEGLIEVLSFLGVNTKDLLKGEVTPKVVAELLDNARGTEQEKIIHTQILRSLAKAKYTVEPLGHFGLVLDNYSHFTSPIRRYPDLVIHRILGDVVTGLSPEKIKKRYEKFAVVASTQSSLKEVAATEAERNCEDSYKAQYMSQFMGKQFEATVSSVTNFGVYVELDNTVEGLVKAENFPLGKFELINHCIYKNQLGEGQLSVGSKVRVSLIATNTSLGQVDFMIKEIL